MPPGRSLLELRSFKKLSANIKLPIKFLFDCCQIIVAATIWVLDEKQFFYFIIWTDFEMSVIGIRLDEVRKFKLEPAR